MFTVFGFYKFQKLNNLKKNQKILNSVLINNKICGSIIISKQNETLLIFTILIFTLCKVS